MKRGSTTLFAIRPAEAVAHSCVVAMKIRSGVHKKSTAF